MSMGSSSPSIQKTSSLTRGQRRISGRLEDYIYPRIGQPLETWGPTSPLAPGGQGWWYTTGPMDALSRALVERYATTPYDYQFAQYIPGALEGMRPEATEQWYNQYMLPAQRRLLEQEILPRTREAYVGRGIQGPDLAAGESRAVRDWGTARAAELGSAIMQQRAQATQMLPQVAAMEQMLAGEPMQRVTAAQQQAEMERMLRVRELQARLQEFVRTRPEYAPVLQLAMQYLQQPLMAAYGTQGVPSGLSQILPGLISAGGALGAAAI